MNPLLTVYDITNLSMKIDTCLEGIRQIHILADSQEAAHTTNLQELIIMDEGSFAYSEKVGDSSNSYMNPHELSLTQNRSTGRGYLINMQGLSIIKDVVLENMGTVVIRRCPNPKDARLGHQLVHVPESEIPEIQKLPVDEAYVWHEGCEFGVRVKVPDFDLGPYPSDDEVRKHMAPLFEDIERHLILSPAHEDHIDPIPYVEILGEESPKPVSEKPASGNVEFLSEHLELLKEIQLNKIGLAAHFKNLDWSPTKGRRILNFLESVGAVQSQKDGQPSVTGRKRILLSITERGKEILDELSTKKIPK